LNTRARFSLLFAATSLVLGMSGCAPTPQAYRIAGSPASSSTHNVLFLGAGFQTDGELEAYRVAAKTLADGLLGDTGKPFADYGANLSFWRVDVRSGRAIDTSKCAVTVSSKKAAPCGHLALPELPAKSAASPLETVNLAGEAVMDDDLDVRLCYSDTAATGSCLLLWASPDGQKIAAELATTPPDIDTVVILANTQLWSGGTVQGVLSGGQSLVVIGVPLDGSGVPNGFNLLAHELGHTLGLADEYTTGSGTPSTSVLEYANVWQPPDPCYAPVIDAMPMSASGETARIPWVDLLACETGIDPALDCDYDTKTTDYGCPRVYWPTHDLLTCPNASHGVKSECLSYVGLFEGAFYKDEGYYRPAWNCKMRDASESFCPACDAWIRKFFECNYVHPGTC
jgi:hypothetical protein